MRGEASVRAFRGRQLALGHTLPLGSYLLKPVQRILKYHLLLGNIVKHFEEECSGYPEIWNALSAIAGMAHHINYMKSTPPGCRKSSRIGPYFKLTASTDIDVTVAF